MKTLNNKTSGGPGTVSQALCIHYSHTGLSLLGNKIWIEDRNYPVDEKKIVISKRIGVEYAGEHAKFPYRFVLKI